MLNSEKTLEKLKKIKKKISVKAGIFFRVIITGGKNNE